MAKTQNPDGTPADAVPSVKYVVAITKFGPHDAGATIESADLPPDTDFARLLALGVLKPATVTVPA